MTYREVKRNFYGVKIRSNVGDITIGMLTLMTMVKPEYLSNLQLHICGDEAYITI